MKLKFIYAFKLFDKIADGLSYAKAFFFMGRTQTAQLNSAIFNHFHSFSNALMQFNSYI